MRRRERSTTGHFVAATYTIYEKPIREALKPEKPVLDKPDEDEYMPWCRDDLEARKPFTTRQDFEDVRDLVKRQIQYDDLLKNQWKYNRERLDEIVEIMVELHTTPEAAIRISGREWPAWAIQDRLKKLTYDSLMTVYYNLDRTKNDIRNIKNYLIATLMNTPITQESQFTAEYRAHPV